MSCEPRLYEAIETNRLRYTFVAIAWGYGLGPLSTVPIDRFDTVRSSSGGSVGHQLGTRFVNLSGIVRMFGDRKAALQTPVLRCKVHVGLRSHHTRSWEAEI